MPTSMILLLFVLAAAPSQRIEAQFPDRSRITRVETAMNHLTVIELAEPVTLAAAGSPLFKVERRDNKVFIQPLEEGSSTNLFVWTASGRWSYELVPAVSPATMHFAIDQQAVPISQSPSSLDTVPPANPASDAGPFKSFAEEMLLFAKPIRNLGVTFRPTEVGAYITDVYRRDDQLFIRYVIDNGTARPFAIGIPEVVALESAQSATSLYAFRYAQVGENLSKKIRSQGQVPIKTIDCEVPSDPLPPGERATGILIVQSPPSTSEPVVLKFSFPNEKGEPIALTLVL
jgi:hypothetical protein